MIRNFALLQNLSVGEWVSQINEILKDYLEAKYSKYIGQVEGAQYLPKKQLGD